MESQPPTAPADTPDRPRIPEWRGRPHPLVLAVDVAVEAWARARLDEMFTRLPESVARDRRRRLVVCCCVAGQSFSFALPGDVPVPAHVLVVNLVAPLDSPANVELLAHELAHSALGHCDRSDPDGTGRAQREADVRAYLPTLAPPPVVAPPAPET